MLEKGKKVKHVRFKITGEIVEICGTVYYKVLWDESPPLQYSLGINPTLCIEKELELTNEYVDIGI